MKEAPAIPEEGLAFQEEELACPKERLSAQEKETSISGENSSFPDKDADLILPPVTALIQRDSFWRNIWIQSHPWLHTALSGWIRSAYWILRRKSFALLFARYWPNVGKSRSYTVNTYGNGRVVRYDLKGYRRIVL